MKNKKGLSEVVTNVLIILLVVVAVGLLWAFVSPLFTKGGEKLQQAEACLNVKLEPEKCVVAAGTPVLVNATVSRNEVKATLKEIKLIFEMPDGSTNSSVQTANLPNELETKVYANIDVGGAPKKLSVAAGLEKTDGTVGYCLETAKIDCV